MTDQLPQGWAEVLLPNVAMPEKFAIVDGPFGSDLKLSDYVENGTVPVLTTKNLTGAYDPSSVRFISEQKFEKLKRSAVNPGDILIAKIGSIGKCSIYPANAPTAIIPANLCKISVNNQIALNRFIFWQIRTRGFQDKLKEITAATAQPAFSVQRLKTLSVRLAPLPEQCRIVAKLEKLLGGVDSCQHRLGKIPLLIKRFRQSVLTAACSGDLTADWREQNETDWDEVTLADVILEKPKNGYSAKPVNYKTGWRVLTLTATTSGRFDDRQFKYFNESIPKDSPFWLHPGDILVQRGNTIEYVGVPAIYDGPPNEFIYPDLMMRFRANSRITTKFLYFALSWDRTRNFLRERATGTAGNMPKINQPLLMSAPISLPPLAEQEEIVRRVDKLFALSDRIEASYLEGRKRVDGIAQSILSKAFRGELVPTEAELAKAEHRLFESAEELLVRIQAKSEEQPSLPHCENIGTIRSRSRKAVAGD